MLDEDTDHRKKRAGRGPLKLMLPWNLLGLMIKEQSMGNFYVIQEFDTSHSVIVEFKGLEATKKYSRVRPGYVAFVNILNYEVLSLRVAESTIRASRIL